MYLVTTIQAGLQLLKADTAAERKQAAAGRAKKLAEIDRNRKKLDKALPVYLRALAAALEKGSHFSRQTLRLEEISSSLPQLATKSLREVGEFIREQQRANIYSRAGQEPSDFHNELRQLRQQAEYGELQTTERAAQLEFTENAIAALSSEEITQSAATRLGLDPKLITRAAARYTAEQKKNNPKVSDQALAETFGR